MSTALETTNLGKRYGRTWALRDCAVKLPAGRVAALVGPNGAGKTTLLNLAVGLLQPTEGEVRVFGSLPRGYPLEVLPYIGFLAQDHPLYRGFSVADLLTMGRKLNPRWDQKAAVDRLSALEIPLKRRADKLSGGQQVQVALAMALAKRPDLLLLDEPLALLDPLARRNFLRVLMGATAEDGLTVLLSSHIITDLERVCDYLIILSASRVQLAGDIEEIVRFHKWLVGPRTDPAAVASIHNVVEKRHTERQTTLLVRVNGHLFDTSWEVRDATLEDIVLAYMSQTVGYQQPEKNGLRWMLVKVGAQAGAALLVFAVLTPIVLWWIGPFIGLIGGGMQHFDFVGTAPLAYMVYALALAIAAGTLLRKTVPAMFVTLVGYLAVRIPIEVWARPNYLPPLSVTWDPYITTPKVLPGGQDWILFQNYVGSAGHPVPTNPFDTCGAGGPLPGGRGTTVWNGLVTACVHAHGWLYTATWQSADRFWLFQGIESAIFFGLAAALLALAFWWVRTRIG